MAKPKASDNSVCQNKRASFRYEILEKLECGIVLTGTEVKSLRDKNASIEEAYVRMDGNELYLIGAHISPYSFGHARNHDPVRKRKLLAKRQEIGKLAPRVVQRGLTLVPLRIYFNERGIAKVSIGLARGKTLGDKRETLKAKEHKREMDRATKRR